MSQASAKSSLKQITSEVRGWPGYLRTTSSASKGGRSSGTTTTSDREAAIRDLLALVGGDADTPEQKDAAWDEIERRDAELAAADKRLEQADALLKEKSDHLEAGAERERLLREALRDVDTIITDRRLRAISPYVADKVRDALDAAGERA